MTMFYVGQRVVCVDSGPHMNLRAARANCPLPIKDKVYVIRGIIPPNPQRVGLLLEGLHSGIFHTRTGAEIGFCSSRFRPVIERKTDTGFAVLEEIRDRESIPADEKRVPARAVHASHE